MSCVVVIGSHEHPEGREISPVDPVSARELYSHLWASNGAMESKAQWSGGEYVESASQVHYK